MKYYSDNKGSTINREQILQDLPFTLCILLFLMKTISAHDDNVHILHKLSYYYYDEHECVTIYVTSLSFCHL